MSISNGTSKEGESYSKRHASDDLGRLECFRGEGKGFGFSGSSGVGPGYRAWSGVGEPQQEGGDFGGIGSRLISKLLEQRAEVLSRYQVVLQRKAEYESKLQQIDRELSETRAMLAEILGLEQEGQEELAPEEERSLEQEDEEGEA